MGSGWQGLGAPCLALSPSSAETLTGLQPPVIGGSLHCLIPHIPVVDQILHQGVHVTCGGGSGIGALAMAPTGPHNPGPHPFPQYTHLPACFYPGTQQSRSCQSRGHGSVHQGHWTHAQSCGCKQPWGQWDIQLARNQGDRGRVRELGPRGWHIPGVIDPTVYPKG